MASNPIVSIDFVINGVQSESIRITQPDLSTVNTVSEDAKASNTSFEYSGRHDHGELPHLKKDGPHAVLVAALQEAKRECDRILTQKINAEYGYGESEPKMDVDTEEADVADEEPQKKAKIGHP